MKPRYIRALYWLAIGLLLIVIAAELSYGSESIEQFTQRHEGLRLKPYHDSRGYLTLGYGHRIPANYTLPTAITPEEAQAMLALDLNDADTAVVRLYPDLASHPKDVRFVLTAMAFQLGPVGLGKFAAMRKAIDQRDYAKAAMEILHSRFAQQTPKRAQELAALMYKAGEKK